MTLEAFLTAEKPHIVREIKRHIRNDRKAMRADPDLYTEHGCDEPSIDIRLCVDKLGDSFEWIVRVGSVDFDQYHSDYCSASSYGIETNGEELATELIEEILEQEAMRGDIEE